MTIKNLIIGWDYQWVFIYNKCIIWHQSTSNKRKTRQTEIHQNLKLLCLKGYHQASRDNPQKKIFANYDSAKGLVYRLYKGCLQFKIKKTTQTVLYRYFSEDKQMVNKHMKSCLSSVIMELKIKTTTMYHFTYLVVAPYILLVATLTIPQRVTQRMIALLGKFDPIHLY